MSSRTNKIIWIDLENSPHIPFFSPIINELGKEGYSFFLTARDCSQTCGLADKYHLRYMRIGRHYGKNKVLKVIGLIIRSLQMMPAVLRERPAVALSHGSRTQLLLSKILGIRTVVITDYEHANELFHPDWMITPEVISMKEKRAKTNFLRYPGIKEDVYVPAFKPDPAIRRELGLKDSEFVATIRPPASEAHYHNPEGEQLFYEAVESLAARENTRIIVLPRNEKQGEDIRSRWPQHFSSGKIVIPRDVVDGLNLIWHSDIVIGGGGTMNREAAALGVPVYSIFRGKIGAVDRYLSEKGELVLLETVSDVRSKIRTTKREKPLEARHGNRETLKCLVSVIEKAIQSS